MANCVFITGANRGIGLSLTELYLERGWNVHATSRNVTDSDELQALRARYSSLSLHELDITDYAKIALLAQSLPPIDLLINNAGYYGPKGYGFGNTDVDEWRKVLEINTIAPLKLVETLYPQLQQGQLKKIACISSKVGSMTENTSGGGYIYRSSKAALNSVVKSLSNDLTPDGVTVLALHPGWVRTAMGGPNALIDAETSAQGLAQVIDQSTVEHSGQFINYDGTSLPW
ncbi:SDR family oxidoreductase [Vibrio parahaemolyticus]|uniref:SDR family oxidoreductase n=1 Tax=Vibrio parahaemolyticus TaxID=670 RepID=UPI00112086B6|nr:SDR family oxidoreductase [Vibrio parahaemolyticus]ELA9310653.1 SDR family oxidoreductase [Vibrio parahaemolyticus]MBE4115730.1 SDR family oxidoreductase [Vibrio parahaemolyticus]TOB36370.1 short-chain dehydrogenase [Vibrio parahaemolyticus]TOP60142.1 short-chain dehydrogenase [Vibrio parahaemolyticus]